MACKHRGYVSSYLVFRGGHKIKVNRFYRDYDCYNGRNNIQGIIYIDVQGRGDIKHN